MSAASLSSRVSLVPAVSEAGTQSCKLQPLNLQSTLAGAVAMVFLDAAVLLDAASAMSAASLSSRVSLVPAVNEAPSGLSPPLLDSHASVAGGSPP